MKTIWRLYARTSRRTSWVTDMTLQSDSTGLLFRVRGASFHIYSLLTFFLCSIVLFLSAIPMRGCLGKHSCMSSTFPIAILNRTCRLSSGTNTLLWWRACYQKLNYKQKQNYMTTLICDIGCVNWSHNIHSMSTYFNHKLFVYWNLYI